jgi:hypothetical protein
LRQEGQLEIGAPASTSAEPPSSTNVWRERVSRPRRRSYRLALPLSDRYLRSAITAPSTRPSRGRARPCSVLMRYAVSVALRVPSHGMV